MDFNLNKRFKIHAVHVAKENTYLKNSKITFT